MSNSVPCQRCGKRNALQRKCKRDVAVAFFIASTYYYTLGKPTPSAEVRLCSSCERTVDNALYSIAKSKTHSPARNR
jgi:hypothetical protein